MFVKNVAWILLLAIYGKIAAAINCYDCSSSNNSMCLDPTLYDEETLRMYLPANPCGHGIYTADKHGFFCRKIIQTILHKGYAPEVRVTRGCGWVRHHKDCYKADNEDHLETVCQCFSDGCNGAGDTRALGVVVVTAALGLLGKVL